MLSSEDAKLALARQYVLDKIASGEATDYTTLYGGGKFSDLSRHPDVHVPLPVGKDGKKRFSSAAGRYQFLKPTWDTQAAKLGLKDFSPASQDVAAWDLARNVYKTKTGRDLEGDASARIVNWGALGDTWTSLKGAAPEGQKDVSGTGAYVTDVPDEHLKGAAQHAASAAVLGQMASGFKFTPVDYDPFAIQGKMMGGK